MRLLRHAIFASAMAILVSDVSGQGHSVRQGFQVTMPSYTYNPDENMLEFRIGYHIRSLVEFGFGFERLSNHVSAIVTTSWVPSIGVYLVRQSDRWPVSTRLGGAYMKHSLAGKPIVELEEAGKKFSSHGYRLEFEVSRRINMNLQLLNRETAAVIILVIRTGETRTTIERDTETEEFQQYFGVFLIEMNAGEWAYIIAGPRIGIASGKPTIGVSFSVGAGHR